MYSLLNFFAFLLLFPFALHAQIHLGDSISVVPIQVSTERTVSLRFAAAIKSIDRGSAELLAQKAAGVENVLLIKAAGKDFRQTSLIVITADGDLHGFDVSYKDTPLRSNHQINPQTGGTVPAQISGSYDAKMIQEAINLALMKEPNIYRRKESGDFGLTVDGFYVKDEIMLLRLSLENGSVINYEPEAIRIFTTDRKKIKRFANQQQQLTILNEPGERGIVKASEQRTLMLAIPKLTIPDSKQLRIGISEKNGSRHITIDLKSRHFQRIRPL